MGLSHPTLCQAPLCGRTRQALGPDDRLVGPWHAWIGTAGLCLALVTAEGFQKARAKELWGGGCCYMWQSAWGPSVPPPGPTVP